MLDLYSELEKYEMVLGIDEVEDSLKNDDSKDILELLQYISAKISAHKE